MVGLVAGFKPVTNNEVTIFNDFQSGKGFEMIKTKEDYIDSLRKLDHVVYYRGKRVEDVTTAPGFYPSHQRRGQDL